MFLPFGVPPSTHQNSCIGNFLFYLASPLLKQKLTRDEDDDRLVHRQMFFYSGNGGKCFPTSCCVFENTMASSILPSSNGLQLMFHGLAMLTLYGSASFSPVEHQRILEDIIRLAFPEGGTPAGPCMPPETST